MSDTPIPPWDCAPEERDDCRLLPCPFCGGQGSFLDFRDACDEPIKGDYVPCCQAYGCWATLGAFSTEDEAVAAWNRRAGIGKQLLAFGDFDASTYELRWDPTD